MSLLAPLFLLGALAVALPVIFHLIRRTSREKTLFSSLMFLLQSPPRLTRRSRLEHVLLLLLRCSVLCLLALGFARPFFRHPIRAEPAAERPRKLVVLLDTSASMKRSDLWANARARAGSVLKSVGPADQVALFTFDRQVNRLVTFDAWTAMAAGDRVALTSQRLAQARPTWFETRLDTALTAAAETLEESPAAESPDAKQIVVISDFQEGSHIAGLQAYEWPRGIEVRLEPVKARQTSNVSLQLLAERDVVEAPPTSVGPRVRVANARDSQREKFQVGWARPGENRFLGPALDVYVPPGQSRVVQLPPPVSGADRLRLSGGDDDFDDAVYVVPPESETVRILYVGNDNEQDAAQLLYYLKRAFQQTRHEVAQVVTQRPEAALLPATPPDMPLVIVGDAPDADQLKTLRAWLTGGETVLFVMKSVLAAQAAARLAGAEALAATDAPASGYAMLGQVDFQDRVFAPFADPRYSDFTKIHFWKFRRLDPAQLPGARTLARFDSGDPALLELSVGKGTLLLLTSSWQPSDSQLALSSKFVPLLYSILDSAGGLKSQSRQFTVGETVRLPTRALTAAGRAVIITKPDGGNVNLSSGDTFSQTDEPGIYTVTSAQPPVRFAVNLDPNESRTAPMATEQLERLGVPVKDLAKPTITYLEQKRRFAQAAESEDRQKLWRWLLVAALVLVMVESGLAGWLTRRAARSAVES